MMRIVLAWLVAVMLALTGQSMAVARGATDAAGQMVICTGTGPVMVYLDATGAPTQAPHICPDAVIGFGTFAETVQDVPAFVGIALNVGVVRPAHLVAGQSGQDQPRLRGPPVEV